MSKIFKISGNFMQYGKWSEPDPSFVGEIVVEDEKLQGYCNELYEHGEMSEVNKVRYLVGALTNNGKNGNLGAIFFKLSNDTKQSPLRYVVYDLTNPAGGFWEAMRVMVPGTNLLRFVQQGRAKITIEEQDYSEEKAARIKAEFEKLDTKDALNNLLATSCSDECLRVLTLPI